MRKLIFPLMGMIMALCLIVAPPLIGTQAHVASLEPLNQHGTFDKAPASAAFACKGLEAAPVATNHRTSEPLNFSTRRLTHESPLLGSVRLVWQRGEAAAAFRRSCPET